MTVLFEDAVLFTPGRASYATRLPDGDFGFELTEASQHRADVAVAEFEPGLHSLALFAGGHPGVAQKWPPEHVPPIGHREADLMAVPLQEHLKARGWSDSKIATRVATQGISDNSIGDVAHSMSLGYLPIESFHRDETRGITLVAGSLHCSRFRSILVAALDIDPAAIQRVPIRDVYGTPSTDFRRAEPKPVAIAKELAAIALTKIALRVVIAGDVESLFEAEERFKHLARVN